MYLLYVSFARVTDLKVWSWVRVRVNPSCIFALCFICQGDSLEGTFTIVNYADSVQLRMITIANK